MSEETLNKQLSIVQEAMKQATHLGDEFAANEPFENIAYRHLAVAEADLKIKIDEAKRLTAQKEANKLKENDNA